MHGHITQAAPGARDDGYTELANAIVLQAARDYRMALKCLQKNPDDDAAKADKAEVERFFHSDWYGVLTNVDGEMLIRALKAEVSA